MICAPDMRQEQDSRARPCAAPIKLHIPTPRRVRTSGRARKFLSALRTWLLCAFSLTGPFVIAAVVIALLILAAL